MLSADESRLARSRFGRGFSSCPRDHQPFSYVHRHNQLSEASSSRQLSHQSTAWDTVLAYPIENILNRETGRSAAQAHNLKTRAFHDLAQT
jgi:hypothetical protein